MKLYQATVTESWPVGDFARTGSGWVRFSSSTIDFEALSPEELLEKLAEHYCLTVSVNPKKNECGAV